MISPVDGPSASAIPDRGSPNEHNISAATDEGVADRTIPVCRIWLDITTTRQSRSIHDGTTRTERGLIRELPTQLGKRLGFCAYNAVTRTFGATAPPQQLEAAAAPAVKKRYRRGTARYLGKQIERGARRAAKGLLAYSIAKFNQSRNPFPDASPGDILLLAGENWNRYDFQVLRRLATDHGVRIAAILQDMIPLVHPQFFRNAETISKFQAYVDFLANDSTIVLVISESTRRDFLNSSPQAAANPDKVALIQLGADLGTPGAPATRPEALARMGDRPFVLSVSTIQARKNFDLLYRLWQSFAIEASERQDTSSAPPPHLVIVGRPGFGSESLLQMMGNDPWIAETVTVLHSTSDAELAWLYSHCRFTLYPSWYEGWGLPLSESLAYGKTFIASDRSSLPEAGQGLGIHLNPYDFLAWRNEVLALASDDARLAAIERRILQERLHITWADSARSIVDAIATARLS